MPTAATVATSSRFAEGLTWNDFLAGATVNRDKFEKNYAHPVLTGEDLALFRQAAGLPHGPRKLLAIAEPWCGDVHHPGLRLLRQAAEEMGCRGRRV
jgi:hypothetical protein